MLYWWLSVFLEVMQQGLPGFAEVESPISVHLPRKMEPIEGSETSAFKPQTLGKYPKENILQNHYYLNHFALEGVVEYFAYNKVQSAIL